MSVLISFDIRNVKLSGERSMRSKETASDYRYYPEMDLSPILIEDVEIERAKNEMPELPWEKRERFSFLSSLEK